MFVLKYLKNNLKYFINKAAFFPKIVSRHKITFIH